MRRECPRRAFVLAKPQMLFFMRSLNRFTWEVVRRNRAGRAIVLTTHSMEEADLLADSIAIMAAGRLVAEGTPVELKARYSVGYTLSVVKQRPVDSDRCPQAFAPTTFVVSTAPV